MHRLEGGCHCGNIRVEMELSKPPAEYSPRACDCDFCRKHGASYVSDPQGAVRLAVGDGCFLGRYRQGAGIAECQFCTRCGVLVGVLYREEGRLYATVNVAALPVDSGFAAPIPVSPKRLAAAEKIARWQTLWFSQVTLAVADAPPR